jgi:hypothetical protein
MSLPQVLFLLRWNPQPALKSLSGDQVQTTAGDDCDGRATRRRLRRLHFVGALRHLRAFSPVNRAGHPAMSIGRPAAPWAAGIRISRTPFLNDAFAWSVMVPAGRAIVR